MSHLNILILSLLTVSGRNKSNSHPSDSMAHIQQRHYKTGNVLLPEFLLPAERIEVITNICQDSYK